MADTSKTDLVKGPAEKTGVGQKEVKILAEGMLESVTGYLKGGDTVQLTGFGTSEVRGRSARTGVKPGTTEEIDRRAGTRRSKRARASRMTSPSSAGQP